LDFIIDVAETLEVIFGPFNGSVNFYMWHGGSNFGFNAGIPALNTKTPTMITYLKYFEFQERIMAQNINLTSQATVKTISFKCKK
jgi:hypothetical protein